MSADSSHQIGQTVGARLRVARLAKKYTQNQLARPDFSVSYISAIERGQIQPSLRALEILAQRLELSTADLLPAPSAVAGVLMPEVENAVPGGDEREVLLLEAQVAIYQRKPARAVDLLRSLLPQKGERRPEKASELYYVLGWAYLAEGRLQESEQLLAEAARLAREIPDPYYPCILGLQSAVYTAMRNTEQAVQVQRESSRVLARQSEASNNVSFLAQLHSSIAQHYNYLGEYEQAIEQFQQTVHLLQVCSSCQHSGENYQQLLLNYTEKEYYSLAMLYGYKELMADFRCQLKDRRNEIEYALGRTLLKSDPERAYDSLLVISQEAEARQDPVSQAGANVQIALWLLRHDELDQAEQLVHRVQEQIGSLGKTLVNADMQFLMGELAYKRQDYNAGDHFFEEGLTLLEQIGTWEDLIEQFARYAQLLEERNCIQKSIMYWKRAYESRQKNRTQAF